MKRSILAIGILATSLFAGCTSTTGSKDAEMDKFVSELMSKMTTEEKIGQLNLPVTGNITTGQAQSSDIAKSIKEGKVGGLFNLKGVDAIKEMQQIAVDESRLGIPLIFGMDVIHGYETVFPIPLGLSCSWDMELIKRSAQIAAAEASSDGICWTFSPMVDVSKDARWGRISEGSGEDAFLGNEIAKAMIYGYQGDSLSTQLKRNDQIMACVKHFALYGAGEAGLDYNVVDMSKQRMFNEFLSPYKAAIDAGAGSIMASFNEIEGVPATGNKWLLTDLLRNEWGFNGFVVTDYTGISEMIVHGIGDYHQVSVQAINAGVDMDMVSEGLLRETKAGLDEGSVSMATLDNACRRILEAKYKLGLFDDPYKYCDSERAKKEVYSSSNRAEARKIAAESFVLLKNEPAKNGGEPLLPLKKQGTVAVIGPLAGSGSNMPGTWSVAAKHDQATSLIDGLKETLGSEVNFLYAKGSNLTKDAAYEERATMFGRTLHRDSRTDNDLLSEALRVAAKSDVIVAALGEASEMSGECSSRADITIPDVQKNLLKALLATGKPVVLVLFNGRPLEISWESEAVPAILDVWFGGTEAAYAISDVLFGDVNPSGKLTTSFPRTVGQEPLYYAHKNSGRALAEGHWFEKFRTNYLDTAPGAVYPFGYGLSYTSFEYGAVTLDSDSMNADGKITASVTVKNTGAREGKEVVQMYIQDVVGSVTRPVRELRGFEKISLQPGESKTVTFAITKDLLEFYNHDLQKVVEPGDFNIFIGGDCTSKNSASFKVN